MNRNERDWLQERVTDLNIRGYNQTQIAEVLKVSQSQVSRILSKQNEEARANIQNYVTQDMPVSFARTLKGLDLLLQESWRIILSTDNDSVENKSLKLKAIATCNDIYRYHTELMLDTRPLKEAVNFMRDRRKEFMLKSINNTETAATTKTATELPIEDLPSLSTTTIEQQQGEGIN